MIVHLFRCPHCAEGLLVYEYGDDKSITVPSCSKHGTPMLHKATSREGEKAS